MANTSTRRVLWELVAGLAAGLVVSSAGEAVQQMLLPVADTVGALWVGALRMTVVPLVMALVIVSVASVSDAGRLGRLGGWALGIFVLLLVVSAGAAALVAPAALTWLPMSPDTGAAMLDTGTAEGLARGGAERLPSVGQWLVDLVPVNPIRAAADGAMLPLVLFTLLFALATTRIPPEQQARVVGLFEAVGAALLVLVRWIVALAPMGVFALMLALAARLGATAAGAFGFYVALVSTLLALQTAALYPLVHLGARVSMPAFARAAFRAQAVAVSTRSSLAALPAMVEGAEQGLHVPRAVAGFVLPLAVSVFKFSAPLSSVVGTLFVARLYQVDLAPVQVAFVAAAAVALSFSTPGIPAGNLVVLAPVFASLGLPVEGIGILIALDVIPDTVKTTGNVTANMAVTAIVARLDDGSGSTLGA